MKRKRHGKKWYRWQRKMSRPRKKSETTDAWPDLNPRGIGPVFLAYWGRNDKNQWRPIGKKR
jgi:hypothetical protein